MSNSRLLFLSCLLLLLPFLTVSQNAVSGDSTVVTPTAIGSSEIALYGQQTRELINNIGSLESNRARLKEIRESLLAEDSIIQEKIRVLTDTLNTFNIDRLESIQNQLNYINTKDSPLLKETENWRVTTNDYKSEIDFYRETWQLTLDSLNTEERRINWSEEKDSSQYLIFNRFKNEISLNLEGINTTNTEFIEWDAELIKTENALAITSDGLNEAFSIIDQKRSALINNIWTPEYAPIWKMKATPVRGSFIQILKDQFNNNRSATLKYMQGNTSFFYGLFFWFLIIFSTIMYLKHRSNYVKSRLASLDEYEQIVLKYPLIISYVIILFWLLLTQNIPSQLNYSILLISIPAFSILIWELNEKHRSRRVLLFVFVSLLLISLSYLGLTANPLRITLIVINLFLLYLIASTRKNQELHENEVKYWFGTLKSMMVFFFFVNILSIIANILGSVQLSLIITRASLGTVIAYIIIRESVLVVQAFIHLVLLGPLFKRSYILQQDSELVISKLNKLLRVAGFILWIYMTLGLLKVRNDLTTGIIEYINRPLQVGELSISFGNVLSFYLIIQISVWLSSFIQYLLRKEIFPRTHLSSGSASTFSLLTKYTITFIGFLFALAGAGIELSKVALGVSALGIGIGFGLQNIINNFVSGIILAVERPFKIGDIVLVDDVEGVVVDIGLRASQIRKWNGSNVLVPNGDLISGKLTNWTYDEQAKRRLNIEIKLPIQTNASKAIELIGQTAQGVSKVLKDPAVFVNHEGVKEGLVLLRLYAWISGYDNGLEIGTALKIEVFEALSDAGYKISMPVLNISMKEGPKASKNMDEEE